MILVKLCIRVNCYHLSLCGHCLFGRVVLTVCVVDKVPGLMFGLDT